MSLAVGNCSWGVRAADPLRARELEQLVREVASSLPATIVIAKQTSLFEQGLSAGRTVDIEITGPEITELVRAGGEMMGRIPQVIPQAQARPIPSLDLSGPEMHIVPKWDQGRRVGSQCPRSGIYRGRISRWCLCGRLLHGWR